MHIAIQTEFSFGDCFLHMKDVHKHVMNGVIGVADYGNTFSHVPLEKESKKHKFKPLYGVRLNVVRDGSEQRRCNAPWIFIAKNQDGLKELYGLVKKSYDDFYYIPRLEQSYVVNKLSKNIIVIAFEHRHLFGINTNRYGRPEDKNVYQLAAGGNKRGNDYNYNFEDSVEDAWLYNEGEWEAFNLPTASAMAKSIADQCEHYELPKAQMVKWAGKQSIDDLCLAGAKKRKLDIVNPGPYKDRYDRELKMIKEKDYVDYFLIVADLINYAKRSMLVGPSRGSSAGSLVCYLLAITEVDPIKHDLIFERFIDVNRFDLPDIDIDFPDYKRDEVLDYLKRKYGESRVRPIANINTFKPKLAISEFAKSLGVPKDDTEKVKLAIIERSSGDARAAMCITDTFDTTEPGKEFIEKYPSMRLVEHIEGHASHAGKHAAGIIVSTLPLSTYCGINSREDSIMLDKKTAEYLGLLKIDALGLRTLSILEEAAEQIGKPFSWYYDLPLDDGKTFKLFNSMRLSSVFQFEGQALQVIVKQMGVNDFNDVAAITALARPGALNSGGTARYIKYSTGVEDPIYYDDLHRSITESTYGIVVYQEQMMEIARKCGNMSWADTSDLRRAASKSMGDEFFSKYKGKFMDGAVPRYGQENAEQLWRDISSSGSWSFNKAHAVSYGLVSYWTAYMKANYPLQFAVANLRHARDKDSAIKFLRDIKLNDGIDYVPVDPDKSDINWSTDGVKVIGGLTNIKGIGISKAKEIIAARKGKKVLTPGLFKKLMNPETEFDVIFPAQHYFGCLYNDPRSYGLDNKPVTIKEIDQPGEYIFIGCLIDRNLRDLNEYVFLQKRNMEREETDHLYLNFKVEDDTDMISCTIGRYDFVKLGAKKIAESGRVGKDWYIIKGKVKGDWRRVHVSEITNLNQYLGVEPK